MGNIRIKASFRERFDANDDEGPAPQANPENIRAFRKRGNPLWPDYSRTLQDMRSYLRAMNVSPRLADDMLATEPEHNHILTEALSHRRRIDGHYQIRVGRKQIWPTNRGEPGRAGPAWR
jgi:hypothetical protein